MSSACLYTSCWTPARVVTNCLGSLCRETRRVVIEDTLDCRELCIHTLHTVIEHVHVMHH